MFYSPHTSWISLYSCVELNTKLVFNKAATAFGKKGFRYSYDGKNVKGGVRVNSMKALILC